MKHLKVYKVFENSNFKLSEEKKKKFISYLENALNGNEMNFTGWIYNNIIRGSEHIEANEFIKTASPKWKTILDHYLSTYKSGPMKVGQDDQQVWFGVNFNTNLKQKINQGDKKITKNFYVTFEKSDDNLKKWFNGAQSLISDFYKACTEGDLKNSAVSFKFGYDANHYKVDNDHLKFYWHNDDDKDKVLKIYNNWIKKTGIITEKRAYDFGVDIETNGKKSSWGYEIAEKVNSQLISLLKQYGRKVSTEKYVNYVLDMLNKTKFKF